MTHAARGVQVPIPACCSSTPAFADYEAPLERELPDLDGDRLWLVVETADSPGVAPLEAAASSADNHAMERLLAERARKQLRRRPFRERPAHEAPSPLVGSLYYSGRLMADARGTPGPARPIVMALPFAGGRLDARCLEFRRAEGINAALRAVVIVRRMRSVSSSTAG
jgi:hypothetical protein